MSNIHADIRQAIDFLSQADVYSYSRQYLKSLERLVLAINKLSEVVEQVAELAEQEEYK